MKTNPRFIEPNLSSNLAYNARFCALAADMGVPAAALAIALVLHQGDNVFAIPGTSKIAHLQELVVGSAIDLQAEDQACIKFVLPMGWADVIALQ